MENSKYYEKGVIVFVIGSLCILFGGACGDRMIMGWAMLIFFCFFCPE